MLGIKCQASQAAVLREFFLKNTDTIKQNGKDKFVPAGLMNMIGKATMMNIIHDNNKYLCTMTSIPIHGLPEKALKIEVIIGKDAPKEEQVCITVQDYIVDAEWYYSLELTDTDDKYYLIITMHQATFRSTGMA